MVILAYMVHGYDGITETSKFNQCFFCYSQEAIVSIQNAKSESLKYMRNIQEDYYYYYYIFVLLSCLRFDSGDAKANFAIIPI
jgi:hypothetical protein